MFTMMKVHPSSKKRTNHRSQNAIVSSNPNPNNTKKLWRLPHVFASVLELPLHSDDDVSIDETTQFLRFVAWCKCRGSSSCGVSAEAVEIVPGITKIVIKGMDGGDCFAQQCYGFRFRLPPWTRPEMATAVCSGGKLVVTVPKTKTRGN
ncbi:hypothetical protein HN51_046828 [Arachis hypogaea]|uniref:SHSP domain-containing protein n=2 Tax=Arachis TaxID=3817 RepID=A0A445EF25_ARAHY|nr:Heat shock 22 kDa protein, putative [Arachis hypogaea]QHO52507.1 Heat shock 22 kDa protein, putative [Arachis hypogaea]RYR74116.1 hypothetical protein Ahy_A02g008740 [Arachis hypogaea]